jgi:tellurite methyltransferase
VADEVKYDRHYRDDPAACGSPFVEFEAFCGELGGSLSVLDLGCGQGRDALMFARAGHRVVGVDVSSVGVQQMVSVAEDEGLTLEGVVQDIRSYRPDQSFDIVILDRVLHMLPEADRPAMLERAMDVTAPGGHLLVAEGPKGMTPVRAAVERAGWTAVEATKNRLIARSPNG